MLKVGIKANWTDVSNFIVGTDPDEDQLTGDASGIGIAVAANLLESTRPGTAILLPNDAEPAPSNYILATSFVDADNPTVASHWVIVHDLSGGAGTFLQLLIVDLVSGAPPVVRWIRNRKNLRLTSDGAGNITVSYETFFGLISSSVISAPAGTEYNVRTMTDNDLAPGMPTFLERAIFSFDCPQVNYSELKKEWDAEIIDVEQNQLRFFYNERYTRNFADLLEYTIYDESRVRKAGVDESGVIIEPNSPTFSVTYGFNPVQLDLADLALDPGVYVIEVITPKDDKQYLKFRVQ